MLNLGLSTYLKIGTITAVLAVIGIGYWHYTSLVAEAEQARAAKAAVEALNDVTKAAEAEQAKSSTLQNAVAKARVANDVELPEPLGDAFLQRFGGGQ